MPACLKAIPHLFITTPSAVRLSDDSAKVRTERYGLPDDGGLSCFDPLNKHFNHYLPNDRKNSLSYHNVHALCIDENNLWIGTYSGNLNVMNLKTGQFKLYPSYSDNLKTLDGSRQNSIKFR